MKKLLLLFVVTCFATISLDAQSKKYVLFEHFTQASCGPCAVQNPDFEIVRERNLGSTHHVAYHTSWPGVDPMNAINPADVQNRVTYYTVTGVPRMHMLGRTWSGSPSGVSDALISSASAKSAPIRLKSSDVTLADGTHEVTLSAIETGDLPDGNYTLKVAVVEGNISYASAPGTNGEREFPNVFRSFLTPAAGVSFMGTGAGTEQTFTYNYEVLDAYVEEDLYILAWLQNETDGIVVNSGSSIDPVWQFVNESESSTISGPGPHTFNSKFSSDVSTEQLVVSLTSDAPSDWVQELMVNGVSVGNGASTEVVVDGTDADVSVVVTTSDVAAIANYTLTLTNPAFPDDPVSTISYRVLSNITDLVIDHGGRATVFNEDFTRGLDAAGNTGYGVLPITELADLWATGQMADIQNIYDNVAWTFPSFTDSEVGVLSEFLDNGGNLFVSGQDIGWDTWDPATAANGTPVTQAFYTDYLRADYIGDGSAADNFLRWSGDVVFDVEDGSAIVDVHAGNIYPDQFDPIEPAVALYHYGSNEAKIGAVRVEENGHKVVYVGVDMGMIADVDVRTAVIQISHDWFQGILSNTEYDQQIKAALGQSYPNPAQDYTLIPLAELTKNANIMVTDVNGKMIHTGKVSKGQSSYTLDVSGLTSGSYFYFLQSEEGQSVPQKLQVVR